ncbi:MAG: DUF2911 domain-containing protein [Planctomycetes bacterium]|nr:DUF2911 domain-containing protein [Planctomycetota bacterium]
MESTSAGPIAAGTAVERATGRRSARRLGLLVSLIAGLVPWLAPDAAAQRSTTRFQWQGQEVATDCGVPRVGKYSIADLQVGQPWRLGAGPASSLTTGAPLLAGELVVPPGSYRIQLLRPQSEKYELLVEGAGRAFSLNANVSLPGTLGEAKPASSKLETTLAAAGDSDDKELRPLQFAITFGVPRITVPFTMVGSTVKKASGATVAGFKLPQEWLEKRLSGSTASPVASVTFASAPKDAPKVYNLLLGETRVDLMAHDAPSSDAFSPLAAHVAKWDRKGSVTWSEGAEAVDHFTLEDAKHEKGKELRLFVRLGKRKGEIVVPLGAATKE